MAIFPRENVDWRDSNEVWLWCGEDKVALDKEDIYGLFKEALYLEADEQIRDLLEKLTLDAKLSIHAAAEEIAKNPF